MMLTNMRFVQADGMGLFIIDYETRSNNCLPI